MLHASFFHIVNTFTPRQLQLKCVRFCSNYQCWKPCNKNTTQQLSAKNMHH